MTLAVFMVLAILESTLPSFCLSHTIQDQEATVMVLVVLVFMTVSVMTPFSDILRISQY